MKLPGRPAKGQPLDASWGLQIVEYLRSITPRTSASIRVSRAAGGSSYELRQSQSAGGGASFPWSKLSFGYRLVRDTEADPPEWLVRIFPGAIRLHGVAVYSLEANPLLADDAGAEVTLTGSTVWVYAYVARGAANGTTVSIDRVNSEPLSTSTTLRLPLYKFELKGDRYVLAQICNMGDINLDTPLL